MIYIHSSLLQYVKPTWLPSFQCYLIWLASILLIIFVSYAHHREYNFLLLTVLISVTLAYKKVEVFAVCCELAWCTLLLLLPEWRREFSESGWTWALLIVKYFSRLSRNISISFNLFVTVVVKVYPNLNLWLSFCWRFFSFLLESGCLMLLCIFSENLFFFFYYFVLSFSFRFLKF